MVEAEGPERSLSPGDVIQQVARMYRSRVLLFAGCLLAPACLTAAGSVLVTRRLPDLRDTAALAPDQAVSLIVPLLAAFTLFWGLTMVAWVTGLGATAHAAERVGSGTDAGVASAWSATARRGLPMIVLAACLFALTLAGVGGGGFVALILAGVMAAFHPALGLLAFPIIAVAVAVTVFFMIRFIFAPVCVVLERRGPLASLARSFVLTRGRTLPLTVTLLVFLMAQYVVILVIQGPFLLAGRLVSGGIGAQVPIGMALLQGAAGACGNAIGGPFLMIGVALMHRQSRDAVDGSAPVVGPGIIV